MQHAHYVAQRHGEDEGNQSVHYQACEAQHVSHELSLIEHPGHAIREHGASATQKRDKTLSLHHHQTPTLKGQGRAGRSA